MPSTGMENGPLWLAALGLLVLLLFLGASVIERRIARHEREERHQLARAAFHREMGQD